MSSLLVSSKGQVVLPSALRRRLGLGTGSRLEVSEEPDGLRLRVIRAAPKTDLSQLAGLVQAPSRGMPRRLEDVDPASMLGHARKSKR